MKLRYIDAIRGLAILGVMIVHTGQYRFNDMPGFFQNFIDQGQRGVQLFFLASAFTLFLSYHYRENKEKHLITNFYLRRFFRIAPMYYIGIIYYSWQNFYLQGIAPSIGNILSNFFFVHGVHYSWINNLVPGGWSITVEMTFYAIIPILVKYIRSTNKAVLFTIGTIYFYFVCNYLLFKIGIITNENDLKTYVGFYFPAQVGVFGIGIIGYFLIVKKDFNIKPFTLILLGGTFFVHLVQSVFNFHLLFFALAFLCIMYALSFKEYKLVVNKLTVFLGKISYSGYLIHFAVLHWLTKFQFVDFVPATGFLGIVNYGIRLLLVITITSGIALLFNKMIEVPFQKIGKNIIKKRETADNKERIPSS